MKQIEKNLGGPFRKYITCKQISTSMEGKYCQPRFFKKEANEHTFYRKHYYTLTQKYWEKRSGKHLQKDQKSVNEEIRCF